MDSQSAFIAQDRFWPKVEEHENYFGECWNWLAKKDRFGYGKFWFNGLEICAHRFSYEFLKGAIPKGLTLDHLCRVKSCVNPDHLEAVTIKENIRRGNGVAGKNFRKTFCIRGHPLVEGNLKPSVLKKGRGCWTCARQIEKLRKQASRAGLPTKGKEFSNWILNQ